MKYLRLNSSKISVIRAFEPKKLIAKPANGVVTTVNNFNVTEQQIECRYNNIFF